MSGIAGIIRFDGAPVGPCQIEKITGAMSYRGPDGINHWIKRSVALGHCMLRTTPESLEETQPLANEDESLMLVLDGRIDNYEALRVELLGRGARLRTRADAELVLRAYEVWAKECTHHLLGDFAFAIWDARRNELFCARDHFGVKPFHYFKGPRFLMFASDEEAFMGLPEFSPEPNEDRIACVLVPEFYGIEFDNSWLKGIVKLPPGKTLFVDQAAEQVSISTYWQLELQNESQFASDSECEEAFRAVFCEAVRCRLRTRGNPALMLSGGIDSAAVAGAARSFEGQIPARYLHTFSVVSDESETCAETRNIRSIIKGYERHACLLGVPGSVLGGITNNDLLDATWSHAHPVKNAILLANIIYMAASRSGHRVMLDGIDGDLATHTSERYFTSMLRSGMWRQAWEECRHASLNNTLLRHKSPFAMLSLSVWDLVATRRLRRLKNSVLRSAGGQGPFGPSLINRDFAKRISLLERIRDYVEAYDMPMSQQEIHIRALTPVNLAHGMEAFDRGAARHGVEPRHPWADKRVIEFYVRLPLKYKAREGWTKYLVRRATAPWLDKDVCWHKGKDHLGGQLMRRVISISDGLIKSTLEGANRGLIEQYVDNAKIDALISRFEPGAHIEDTVRLHNVATAALWLRRVKLGD